MGNNGRGLNIVVVGASGDLAARKVFPALFALKCRNLLPGGVRIFGFARTRFDDNEFREHISRNLTCRYVPDDSCERHVSEFLGMCRYIAGSYESRESYLNLYARMREAGTPEADTLFYLAIPSSLFSSVASAMAGAGLVNCGAQKPWTRVVVEKPFGKDRASSDDMMRQLAHVFAEEQVFRIDHYLGKEAIQNLMVLRFANLVFEPLWNRTFVRSVHIEWKESDGIRDRGGYFDGYGIIRDVIQNHMLQVLSLVAMERPARADAAHISDEKVRVLRSIRPAELENVVLGQYAANGDRPGDLPEYRAEKGVAPGSIIPTYAGTMLRIENARWAGVPFLITAGKGLDESVSRVVIRFRDATGNLFRDISGGLSENRLVIRVQPDEAIFLRITNKEPGLRMSLVESELNLRYQQVFQRQIPEAYERLLLDVIEGDKSLFIRADELAAAWDIYTPLLRRMEEERIVPTFYKRGSAGPESAARLLVAL